MIWRIDDNGFQADLRRCSDAGRTLKTHTILKNAGIPLRDFVGFPPDYIISLKHGNKIK
jgi:hypothetical protein